MSWLKFGRKERRLQVANTANIEIVAAKNASHQASEQAIQDANKLKDLLERNHFSVTLYIAVGGKSPSQTNRKTHA